MHLKMKNTSFSVLSDSVQISFLLVFLLGTCTSEKTDPKLPIEPKILGGDDAPEGRFPYMCSLTDRSDSEHVCAATLIKPKWIITAAHCVDPSFPGSIGMSPLIYCGIYNKNDRKLDKELSADNTFIHEMWNGKVEDGYDIALIELDSESGLSVPDLDTPWNRHHDERLFAVLGWGMNESRKFPDRLQVATELPFIPLNSCNVEQRWNGGIKNSMICAGSSEKDTGRGDSGGPLLQLNYFNNDFRKGRASSDLLVGITSYGSLVTDRYLPGIYTSISYFALWIDCIIDGQDNCTEFTPSSPASNDDDIEVKSGNCTIIPGNDFDVEDAMERAIDAIREHSPSAVESILCEGLNPSTVFGASSTSLMIEAAKYNALECAKVLFRRGADLEHRDVVGETGLSKAARFASIRVLKFLVRKEADLESRDTRGYTPLNEAVWYNHLSVVKTLIASGANVNSKTNIGFTPLHISAQKNLAIIAEELIKSNASLDARTNAGSTPIHIAVSHGSLNVTQLLLDNGAGVNAANDKGSTPLHYAASRGSLPFTRLLLNHGALKVRTDDQGRRPFDVVCNNASNERCKRWTIARLQRLLRIE